jgi:hypothetical protein
MFIAMNRFLPFHLGQRSGYGDPVIVMFGIVHAYCCYRVRVRISPFDLGFRAIAAISDLIMSFVILIRNRCSIVGFVLFTRRKSCGHLFLANR